ncbi:MAG: ABC transporter substrate-binding protein [Novosphingobium sp.]|nr:ABC transporter substrate-binding protein [Novosphingobium sp.]
MPAPIRIGLLNDMADAPPAPGDMGEWIERELAHVRKAGRLSADVELVRAYGLGLPEGSAAAIKRAFAELDAADVVLIVGPAIGDNALIATPLAERAQVPTLNWAGAERARGEWMFHLQVGSHEDESLVIARHLAAQGARRLAVAYDKSPIGERHLAFLADEAALLGQEIAATEWLFPLATEAEPEVAQLLAAAPDAVVYLGLGLSAPAVAQALTARGWSGPRIMNSAGLRGYRGDFARVIDGWDYVDMIADDNRTLAALLQAADLPQRGRLAAAKGHDLGRLVAEALARSSEPTRAGVRQGLERIKWLPAAEGAEGTLLGFGIQDRGALHGRYLIVRRWQNGESIEVDRG